MRLADVPEDRVAEQVVLALGEPTPGLHLYTAVTHEVSVGLALEEGVQLDLIDCRLVVAPDHFVRCATSGFSRRRTMRRRTALVMPARCGSSRARRSRNQGT